jgi:hypothetical protein
MSISIDFKKAKVLEGFGIKPPIEMISEVNGVFKEFQEGSRKKIVKYKKFYDRYVKK